jgi:CBS domain containing-hemolysin-like protein
VIQAVALLLDFPARIVLRTAQVLESKFRPVKASESASQAEEEIKNLIEEAEESGEIEEDERELIHSVFEFGDTIVREIMTPRVDLDAMSVHALPAELAALMRESGHSRIPLFEGTDDQIAGVIHAKDLLMAMLEDPNVSLRRLMRPVLYVTENKNLQQLLKEMRHSRAHLAVVQDEFGGTAGIVTLEDVVEQLVGDIQDEYDQEEEEVVETGSGFLVDGKTHIEDINDEVGADFESEEFDTIGGFVFGLFGRQPKLGEFIHTDGFKFTVADTDGRRILKLQIEREEMTESETLSAIED